MDEDDVEVIEGAAESAIAAHDARAALNSRAEQFETPRAYPSNQNDRGEIRSARSKWNAVADEV